MIYEFGEFFCPKCNQSGMSIYTNWTSRDVFNGEKKIKQYIFYKKDKQKKECRCFMCDKMDSLLWCELKYSSCFIFQCLFWLLVLFYILFYIVLCFWVIDIICYFCCQEKEEEVHWCNIGNEHIMVYCSKYKNIWEQEEISNKGLTKKFWVNKKNSYKDLFQCSKCFYNPNSFFPFIKKNENDSLKVSDTETNNAIAINIISNDSIFPILCYPDDLFKNVLNKFFKDSPQYNLDNCYFLGHAQILQPNLTISKNGIKNGENIQLILNNNDYNNGNNNDFDENDNNNSNNNDFDEDDIDYQAYNDMSD